MIIKKTSVFILLIPIFFAINLLHASTKATKVIMQNNVSYMRVNNYNNNFNNSINLAVSNAIFNNLTIGIHGSNNVYNLNTISLNNHNKFYYSGLLNYSYTYKQQQVKVGFTPLFNNYLLSNYYYFNAQPKQTQVKDIQNQYTNFNINFHSNKNPLSVAYQVVAVQDVLKLETRYVFNNINISNANYNQQQTAQFNINFYNEYKGVGYGFASSFNQQIDNKFKYIISHATLDYLGASLSASAYWQNTSNIKGYNAMLSYNFTKFSTALQYKWLSSKVHNIQALAGLQLNTKIKLNVVIANQIAYNTNMHNKSYYGGLLIEYKIKQ